MTKRHGRSNESETALQKPVMLAARVQPRLQFGLRMLARVQGGTIAEAMERSIESALQQTPIGTFPEVTSLDELVSSAWHAKSEPRRIFAVWGCSPELLEHSERAIWNLVLRTEVLWRDVHFKYTGDGHNIAACDPAEGILSRKGPDFDALEKHWSAIKRVGIDLAHRGDLNDQYSLEDILSGEALSR